MLDETDPLKDKFGGACMINVGKKTNRSTVACIMHFSPHLDIRNVCKLVKNSDNLCQ